jgi:uncharacterized membrane protein HdeD (DUF308 family)
VNDDELLDKAPKVPEDADAPVDRGSFARGFLSGCGVIAAGLAAALVFVIAPSDADSLLALLVGLLYVAVLLLAPVWLGLYYVRKRRPKSAWGVLLAGLVALALLAAMKSTPVREDFSLDDVVAVNFADSGHADT